MRKTNTVQTNDSVAKRFFKSILSSDKLGLLIALAMIVAVFQVLTKGTYLTVGNIRNIMISSAIVGMAMIGETFLMITGGIDLYLIRKGHSKLFTRTEQFAKHG